MNVGGQGGQGDYRDPWRWCTHGDRCGGDNGGCEVVQIGTRVRGLDRSCAQVNGLGRQSDAAGYQQARRTYLRTLLIHGARSVLHHVKEPGPWVEQSRKRRPPNVVIVALANKMARTIWAILAYDRPYQKVM